jgi:GDPmannose 4,6-dehydratase
MVKLLGRGFLILILLAISLSAFAFAGEEVQKKALIFGVTGQDGAYLSEFLLQKNYQVHGVKRRSSSTNTARVDRFCEDAQYAKRFFLHDGDITDAANVLQLIQRVQPDEIYNLAAQSHVKVSFELPEYTAKVGALGTLHVLEAIRALNMEKKVRFYQASTSEMYGLVQEIPQSETTPFHPRSPYAIAKLYAYWTTINYREAYGMYACNGILFNHESPLRGETFVTRKITLGACRYKLGLQDSLYLGNLDASRDWGYAKDYVEAMWLMLQQTHPDDYVIATGETHTVREFVELAFKELEIEIEWKGTGQNECGIDKSNGNTVIRIDPHYYRPAEVDFLLGNAKKASTQLEWKPRTSFQDLLKIMIQADYQLALKEAKSL